MRRILIAMLLVLGPAAGLRADDLGLKVPLGFKVTLWADHELANDIYAMTLDRKGNVVVTGRGWVKKLEDLAGTGKADHATVIVETPTGGMGLCYSGYNLFICGDGWFSEYRLPAVGGEPAKKPTLKYIPLAFTEHGGHAMRKGPDGRFYIIYGNSSQIEKIKLDPASPIKKPEAGGILRFSKDMKKVECIAQGFRNPYDFDFTPLGDIITYDSDTERDFLLPWYSPTRMYHVAHGQHHGWRLPGYLQSLARRDYYPDVVDMLWPVGRGSPTGVVCYRHYQFPKHYRGGVFALDWTFGKVYFFPLEPDDSSYKTKPEVFLEPNGINGFAPTDACVAPDGSLFICIGGRGTRGAVYRIEYVGTKEEPVEKWIEPVKDFDKVLDAPQPLDAWSRSNWEELVWLDIGRTEGNRAFRKVIVDEKQSAARRIRAIEILNDLYGGLELDDAKKATMSIAWEVRSRVAWSIGRDFPKGAESLLFGLAEDAHSKVRVEALNSLADLLCREIVKPENDALVPIVAENLGHADKRVRMAACRISSQLDTKLWLNLQKLVEAASLRTRLTFAIADHRHGTEPTVFALKKRRLALDGLYSKDPELRLDALRLLMLIDGDWCLTGPPAVVYSAYALQQRPKVRPDIEKELAEQVRKLFPAGDKNFDTEASRYLAMIEDDDPRTVGKILNRFTRDSSATEDVHHLIVLSRLKGHRAERDTLDVSDALMGLETKLQGAQLRIKQTWGPRLTEVVANLVKQHPGLSAAMIKHAGFVNPANVGFTMAFDKEDLAKAARLFLEGVKKDGDFIWSEELVDLLAVLPPEDYRPVFRKQWSNYSLRDAILKHLLNAPDVADRQRFLDGLDSSQKNTVLACIAALEALPKDPSTKNLVPILRRLRLCVLEPKEQNVREKLLGLLNHQAGTVFIIDAEPKDPLRLKAAYAPVFAWFKKNHPAEAKLLSGDDDDNDFWKKQLTAVIWEKGNAERGAKIFRERSCAVCHSGSSRIGPDLTGVAGRFSRDDLFIAIIYPSRDVAPAYRVNDIETLDGKRFSGIVIFEAAEGVIVQIGATETVRIDGANIASRQPSAKSLMPSGLLKDLKSDDMVDLYAYLKSLKGGP